MTNVVPVHPRGMGVPAEDWFQPRLSCSLCQGLPCPSSAGELRTEASQQADQAMGEVRPGTALLEASAQQGVIFTNRFSLHQQSFWRSRLLRNI